MNKKGCLLALNSITRVGPQTIKKLCQRFSTLEEVFELPKSQLESMGLSEEIAKSIVSFDWTSVEKELHWGSQPGNTIITWDDGLYPALLKEIPSAPPVLYARGEIRTLEMATSVAMVGSRKPSIIGSETAWQFAFELAKANICIVSGLALGVDGQAHAGCLAGSGQTIAVLGSGVDVVYPYHHRRLASQIIENGLLLSEFPLGTKPIAGHFPRRNRIISGLSLATLIVEAALHSGSLITAHLALEQNRDVLAIPGSIKNPQAKGCHHLLQQGAKLITSVEDVLHELFPQLAKEYREEKENKKPASVLMEYIGFETTSVDQILKRSGTTLDKVICELANLELEGFIKAVTGGYTRCV